MAENRIADTIEHRDFIVLTNKLSPFMVENHGVVRHLGIVVHEHARAAFAECLNHF